MKVSYSERFFDEMEDKNLASARAVAPLVLGLVPAKSIVDIGCGRGLWLKAFIESGVVEVQGYDGDYVDRAKLTFPKERFKSVDLEEPLSFGRTYDLAVCLEVAEHLPAHKADILVQNLVNAAPVVLFSAAIPGQQGSHHINEQWPDYWAQKFKVHGYVPVDAIRRHVWDSEEVSFFYKQNILIYIKESVLSGYPRLEEEVHMGHNKALSLVHPHMYLYYAERWRMVVPFLAKLPVGLLHAAKRLLAR